MNIARSLACLFVAALTLLLPASALADWPEKPIRFVVPFPAGGGADSLVRSVAEGMSKVLGQPVIVDNKPGSDAALGSAFVAKAPPDGYTILFAGSTGFSAAPYLHKNLGYDPVKDFTPISMLGMFPFFIAANNDFPAKTLGELVEYVRTNPGKVNYASSTGMGTVATAQLAAAEKLAMTHVPYKGEAPALPDLLGNRVQLLLATNFIIPHVKEGRVRAIVAILDQRHDALPDVPTVAEAGFPSIAIRSWGSVVAPAGLPGEIQEKLARAVNESLRMESTKKALAVQGFPGQGSTPLQLAEVIRAQLALWGEAVNAAGLKPE